jgi:hypothetical protein
MREKRPFEGLMRKPRSKKGWQNWNRKYALAFLHSQLDRVMPSMTKKNYVMSLFTKWEKRFRAECTKKPPEESIGNKHNLVEDQIDFVAQYIACAILDGTGKDNLARIRHFLAMQRSFNIGNRMELRFLGGSPIEAYAYVDSLKDIDIVGVLFITNLDTMCAYREKNKIWTKSAARRFLDDLKKDVFFDMPNTIIMAEADEPTGLSEFEIPIKVDKGDLNLKTFQCMPRSLISWFGNSP